MLPLLIIAGANIAMAIDCFSYAVTTVTDCDAPSSTSQPAMTSAPIETLTVTMPECHICDCPGTTFTKVYTTSYELLCPNGVGHKSYTVTELYPGVTNTPVIAHPTACPEGFTTTVATCDSCGEITITKTLTIPHGGVTSVTTSLPPAQTGTPSIPGQPGNSTSPAQLGCDNGNCSPVVAGSSSKHVTKGLVFGGLMALLAWL